MTEATKLLTPKETAKYLGVREQTLATWRCSARYGLPFIRIGRSVKYRLSDVENWLKSRTVGAAADNE